MISITAVSEFQPQKAQRFTKESAQDHLTSQILDL
jgi:hypothetical protein